TTGVTQKARVFHRGRADNDIGNAVIEVRLYGVEVANSPADSDGDVAVDRGNNGFDGRGAFGLAGHGATQIYQVQAACALVEPLLGHGGRVFRRNGCVVQVALAQANTVPVLEVDGGDQEHDKSAE